MYRPEASRDNGYSGRGRPSLPLSAKPGDTYTPPTDARSPEARSRYGRASSPRSIEGRPGQTWERSHREEENKGRTTTTSVRSDDGHDRDRYAAGAYARPSARSRSRNRSPRRDREVSPGRRSRGYGGGWHERGFESPLTPSRGAGFGGRGGRGDFGRRWPGERDREEVPRPRGPSWSEQRSVGVPDNTAPLRSQVSASGRVHPHWSLPRTKPLNTVSSTYPQRTPISTEDPSRRSDREERRILTPSPRTADVDITHNGYRGRASSSPPRSPRFPHQESATPSWQREGRQRSTSRDRYSITRRTTSLERGKRSSRSPSRIRHRSTDPRADELFERSSDKFKRNDQFSSGRLSHDVGLAPLEERELGEISPDFAPAQPARHLGGSARDRRRSAPGLERISIPQTSEGGSAPLGLGALPVSPPIPQSSELSIGMDVSANGKTTEDINGTKKRNWIAQEHEAVKPASKIMSSSDPAPIIQADGPQEPGTQPSEVSLAQVDISEKQAADGNQSVGRVDTDESKGLTELVTPQPQLAEQHEEPSLPTLSSPQPAMVAQREGELPKEEQPLDEFDTRGEGMPTGDHGDVAPSDRIQPSNLNASPQKDAKSQSLQTANDNLKDLSTEDVTMTLSNEPSGSTPRSSLMPVNKQAEQGDEDSAIEPPVAVKDGHVEMSHPRAETLATDEPTSIEADVTMHAVPIESTPNGFAKDVANVERHLSDAVEAIVAPYLAPRMAIDTKQEDISMTSVRSAESPVLPPVTLRLPEIDEDLLIETILARNATIRDEPISRLPLADEALDVEDVALNFVKSNAKMEHRIRRNIAITRAANRHKLQQKVARLRYEYTDAETAWDRRRVELEKENERLKGEIPLPSELCDGPAAAALDAALAGELRMTTGPRVRATRGATANLQAQGALGVADGDEAGLERALLLISQADQADPTARALRTEAVVPDMFIEGQLQLRTIFDDQSELVEDPLTFYDCMAERDGPWIPQEDIEFRRLFALHPKQFGSIAKGLPGRNVGSCVEHYYTTKKIRSYKELAVGARAGPRRLRGKESALSRDLNRRRQAAPQKSTNATGGDSSRGDVTPRGGGRKPPLGESTALDRSVKRGRKVVDASVDAKELEAALKSGADDGSLEVKKQGRKGMKRKPQDIIALDGVGSADVSEAGRKSSVDGAAPKKRRKAATNADGTPIPRSRKASAGTTRRPSADSTPANGVYPAKLATIAIPSLGMFPEQQRTRMGPVPGYFTPEGSQYQHLPHSHAQEPPSSRVESRPPLHDPQAFRMVQPADVSRNEAPPSSGAVPRPRGGMDIMSLLNNEESTPQKSRTSIDNDETSTASDATEDDKSAALRTGLLSAGVTSGPPYGRAASASTVLDVRLPAWELGPARAVPRDFANSARTIYDRPSDAILNRPLSAMAGFPPPSGAEYRYRSSMPPMMPGPTAHPDPYAPPPGSAFPPGYQQGWTGQAPMQYPPMQSHSEMSQGYRGDFQPAVPIRQPIPYPQGYIRPTLSSIDGFSAPRGHPHDGRASR